MRNREQKFGMTTRVSVEGAAFGSFAYFFSYGLSRW